MNSYTTVKIEVNLGALRIAHGSTMNEMRRCLTQAKKVSDSHLAARLRQQAKSFEDAADELQRAMDEMEVA